MSQYPPMIEREFGFHYTVKSLEELTPKERELAEAAKSVAQDAYAPYSHFCVGAALRLEDGTIVTGSNQENAAYPSGICAERTALFFAGSRYPDTAVEDIAIIALQGGEVQESISPCGACRQVMAEVADRFHPFRVLLVGRDAVTILEDNRDLLPLTFDSSSL